jgi:alanine transaminase
LHTINQRIIKADYAVRGSLVVLAEKIKKDLADGAGDWNFDRVVSSNLGNPQGCGQKPLTFFRQVMALTQYPQLLDDAEVVEKLFPKDALERARTIVKAMGSVGAYSSNYGCSSFASPWHLILG